jgi:cysteinyl-tRNA synthetase
MSKSLKNYTTIKSVLSGNDWTARSLRICFLVMPRQDSIEVTDELMKAVTGWEGKMNNFFLKSLDVWKSSSSRPESKAEGDTTAADRQLLTSLETAKGDVDEALRDSFNTSVVMRILTDIVTEFNSAEALSDQTVILLAQWITRMVAIFGLDPEGDINNSSRIGWSGLEIPEPAKPYVYAASNLRDKIRLPAFADSTDQAAIGELTDDSATVSSTAVSESSKPYHQVLQQFRTDLNALASRQAPAKDLLSLCD